MLVLVLVRYVGIIERGNRTACVPFQFHHTRIAAAAVARRRCVRPPRSMYLSPGVLDVDLGA